MQFKLFDAATNGTQIGTTIIFDNIVNPRVQVTNGIFTVQLNGGGEFGASAKCGLLKFISRFRRA